MVLKNAGDISIQSNALAILNVEQILEGKN